MIFLEELGLRNPDNIEQKTKCFALCPESETVDVSLLEEFLKRETRRRTFYNY